MERGACSLPVHPGFAKRPCPLAERLETGTHAGDTQRYAKAEKQVNKQRQNLHVRDSPTPHAWLGKPSCESTTQGDGEAEETSKAFREPTMAQGYADTAS
ncbi:hypothetical protein HPB48_019553 [Haemaphysalis longicornis]|uniref:Uncharacterized protein n=1 Tax=Haemaphysalis longicornis TaxID=44386 RepID=A0A9J6FRI3_HAELO|nr:hypothetical protein HPB48_019553 [Haemaphysalis longicornis]